jgi:hypothetical protein
MSKIIHAAIVFSLVLAFSGLAISKTPIKIIFDTDMGSDCDDAGALALLHRYADMGLVDILGCMYSSGKVPYGAGVIEAINIYYGRPDIPIGASHGDEVGDPVDKMNAETLAKNTSAFGHTLIHNHDAPELAQLCRKILAAQADHSATYITVGHTKGLYDILVSKPDESSPLTGMELIKKKVKQWVALGALGANNREQAFTRDWNFFFNGTAPFTKYLVDHFPVSVFYINAGDDVMTGKSLKTTPPGNIVRTAYSEWLQRYSNKTLDDQRPSWDLAAVYFAVEGLGSFLERAGQGRLDFDVEKGSRWINSAGESKQTYINQKDGVSQAFSDYLNQMISTPPLRKP